MKVELINEQIGLFSNFLIYLDADMEGGIWSTSTLGLNRIDYPASIRKVVAGIKSKIVALSMINYQQKLFVGTMSGGWQLEPKEGTIKASKLPETNDITRAIVRIRDGLLIGTGAGGIYWIKDSKQSKVADYPATSLCVSVFDTARVFVGTVKGLFSMRWSNGIWIDEGKINGIDHGVDHLQETPNGDLWASSLKVSRLRFVDGPRLNPVVISYDSNQGFATDHVDFDMMVYEDQLYFGTNRGIFRFDEQHQHLVPETKFGERFADHGHSARHLVQDLLGQIWLYDGERGGVLRKEMHEKWQWDDLPLRRMEDQEVWCIYPDPDSLIWIGTTTTLYCYDPRIPKDYHVPYHTLIDRVTVNDTHVVFYGNYADSTGLLVDWQPENYKLTFPYAQNDFAFSYTATSYEYPEKTVFSYWLEGFEEGWSPWMKESDKAYNDLPEGRYTFHARSKNLYDTLGKEAAYSFSILPPWQRTWWAYLAYAGAGLGLIVLIVRWQVGRANRKQETAREVERKQQRAMLQATVDAQENERTRIAKDLHDDIQVTLSTAKLKLGVLGRNMKKQGLDGNETTESVDLIQDAIESVREISQDLLPAALDRLGLVQALQELCEKIDSGEKLKVDFKCMGSERRIAKEVELTIYRVAQELFANALKHAEADRVDVTLIFAAESITLELEDNGKGFDHDTVESSGKGLGFKNMQGRISLVSGEFTYQSELGKGSRFHMKIAI